MTIVLIHGFLSCHLEWALVTPHLSEYNLLLVDVNGHSGSSDIGPLSIQSAAANIVALIHEHAHNGRAHVVGMSMGAKTLLHMATEQPHRVEAMVLVSATPYFPAPARAAMAQLTVELFSDAEWATHRQRHVHGDDQIRMLFEQMRGLKDSHDDMAFTPPLLGTITARTLIVHGDRDPLYPVELALEIYRSIPGSALWVVPNGGHGPIFGPLAAAFVDTAVSFLRDH